MNPTSEQLLKRQELAALLRSPEKWPEGFKWDFNFSCGCAIGLSRQVYGFSDFWDFRQDVLGISISESSAVFATYLAEILEIPVSQVTPEHVAHALETLDQ